MKASVVIGACFGDEGKGLLTDYLSGPDTTVVRFNGGAQAGHTVVTPKQKHVFHHLGSGSLAGAATYLSRFFIVNPFLWQKEISVLGFSPKTAIDPAAPLSTPYDMLINQATEEARGTSRHGSCGLGINETVERVERKEHATLASDCRQPKRLTDKLIAIRECYALSRMSELGIRPNSRFLELLYSESLLESFLVAAKHLARSCDFRKPDTLRNKQLVFEGAQGLLLDQSHSFFPHVTRSNTGLSNVVEIAAEAGFTDLNVYYLTRTYMTRHGAGPFPTEDRAMCFADETNQPNNWQGSLRFGGLDMPLIAQAVHSDLRVKADISINPSLVITHVDQCSVDLKVIEEGLGLDVAMISHGPHRAHVQPVNKAIRIAA